MRSSRISCHHNDFGVVLLLLAVSFAESMAESWIVNLAPAVEKLWSLLAKASRLGKFFSSATDLVFIPPSFYMLHRGCSEREKSEPDEARAFDHKLFSFRLI